MILDLTKDKKQKECVVSWLSQGARGTLEAATGFGKTRVGMLAIERLLNSGDNPGDWNVIVLVPRDHLRTSWREDVAKRGWADRVRVETVQSSVDKPMTCTLLVLDEWHRFASDVFSGIFVTVEYRWILGLTASLPDDPKRLAILNSKAPVFETISLEECLKNGWISDYRIYNLAVPLDENEQKTYAKIDRSFGFFFATFEHDLDLMYQCMASDVRSQFVAARLGISVAKVRSHAVNANRYMAQRKSFVWSCLTMRRTAFDLLQATRHRRVITFSQVTETADVLHEHCQKQGIKSGLYHTGIAVPKGMTKKAYKAKVLGDFASGEISVLNTAKALNEGMNVEGADTGIITSYDSSTIDAIQRTGRICRKVEGKLAIEVNIVIQGTPSERWVKNKQKRSGNVDWVDSVSDIPF